ncbi:MAG: acetyl-CoA carboxylase biotin carboxyl carrier protein [Armatimonadota bacterium]
MDLDRVEAIARLLQRQGHVGEIEVESGDFKLRARRMPGLPLTAAEPDAGFEDRALPEPHRIRSGWVGVFRARAPLPEIGSYVEAGTVLGQIDSMRVLNPVAADQSGYLLASRVEDGDGVEYGQELFVLSVGAPEGSEQAPEAD